MAELVVQLMGWSTAEALEVCRVRGQAGSWSEQLVSATAGSHAPECCPGCFGQQAGSHGLDGLMQERKLSPTQSCFVYLDCTSESVPARSAGGNTEPAEGSIPRFRSLISEKVLTRPSSLKGQGRVSIMARSHSPRQRPNTLAQTNCHSSFFACHSAADHTFR